MNSPKVSNKIMEGLKLTYQDWNYSYYELQSEKDTLGLYENEYKIRVSKRIPKEMQGYTMGQWAHFAYERNRSVAEMAWNRGIDPDEYNDLLMKIGFPFEITALLESNEQPYAFVIFLGEGCTVSFLDELGRTFMSYRFEPSPYQNEKENRKGYLFLYQISLYHYHQEKDEDGDWDYDYTDYEFTPDGRVRKIEEIGDERIIYDSEQRVNVESNWQQYPEFGDWLPLFEMKRWKEDELMPLADDGKDKSHKFPWELDDDE